MLTLRIIPPRLVASRGARAQRDIAGLYFDALWRHWGPADRALALALALGEAARSAFAGPAGWANGWSRAEESLNLDAPDRIAHLGMAARKGLNRIVNPGAYPLDLNPLKNKRLFALRARAAGLPVPHDFSGRPEALGDWLSGEDAVIAKPNFASKGSGVAGFRRGEGGWVSSGVRFDDDAALTRLRKAYDAGGVLQRACATHPALTNLSPGALPTLRVMTAVDENGGVEVLGSVIRVSAGGPRAVDNFNAGNIVAAVDATTGRMGVGYRRVGSSLTRLDRHPTTGVALAGAETPDLDAAQTLAIRAHDQIAEGFRLVGWDIGLSADGPVLIEGNWSPGTDILQLTSGLGVGDTRLGELYRHCIATTPAEVWTRARPIEREPRSAAEPDPIERSGRSAPAR